MFKSQIKSLTDMFEKLADQIEETERKKYQKNTK